MHLSRARTGVKIFAPAVNAGIVNHLTGEPVTGQTRYSQFCSFNTFLVIIWHVFKVKTFLSSFPQDFPITWGRQNGYDYHSRFHFFFPVCSPALTPHFPYLLLHESFHLVFCLPLHLLPGTGASKLVETNIHSNTFANNQTCSSQYLGCTVNQVITLAP